MELLNCYEIESIAKQCGFSEVLDWSVEEFPDKVIGYLGEHLKLIIDVESNGIKTKLNLFVKCMPRFDKWKAQYLKELTFFEKEYVMLSKLFKEFNNDEGRLPGPRKWCPKLLFIKEDIFVFENVTEMGYTMPHHQCTMSIDAMRATVKTLARFHAQSYIYEEKKSKEIGRPYRIWEDYKDYLQEPVRGMDWRDTGRNAVIDFLKVYSKFKGEPSFSRHLLLVISTLFDGAMALMKPSTELRNVVVHRDLWTNNMFLQKQDSAYHVLFVDFQTVLYCSPMLDLSSLIFFNTTRGNRYLFTDELLDIYYNTLTEELGFAEINVSDIINKATLIKSYRESVMFGITQAALIVPIVAMNSQKREQIFYNPETCRRANVISRSEYFIAMAEEDPEYRKRVLELFEEIVERYIYPNESNQHQGDKY